MYDLCALFDDTQLLCQDYEAYAQLCQQEGVPLGSWRKETGCGERTPGFHWSPPVYEAANDSRWKGNLSNVVPKSPLA